MKNGPYILIKPPKNYPGKRYRGKYAYEHHVVYWKKYKLVPTIDQVIHHKNHIRHDNRLSNLELISKKEHTRHHMIVPDIAFLCHHCGACKTLKPCKYRTRFKKNNGRLFCSAKCGALAQHKRFRDAAMSLHSTL